MPLTQVTKGEIVSRMYYRYAEAAGGYQFSTAGMGTFANQALQEFALRSGLFVTTARRARGVSTGVEMEKHLVLPTGVFDVMRVTHQRHIGATVWNTNLRKITPQWLQLEYGHAWQAANETDTPGIGTNPNAHRWYKVSSNIIGLFPPKMNHTAGTIFLVARNVPSGLGNSTASLAMEAQYVPGVVAFGCRLMAERDADADPDKARYTAFEQEGEKYASAARQESGYGIQE